VADPDRALPVDVRALLLPERDAFVELLGGLDPGGWGSPTECPAWSVQGVALHVLGDDLSLLARQRDAATQGLVLFAEGREGLGFRELLDGFNEQWVTASRFLSGPLVLELLRLTGRWTADFYAAVDPEARGEPVGLFAATGPSPYWQIVAREYLERWVHHHQVRRAVGRPELGEPFLAAAGAVVIRAVAAHLRDLGAARGAVIAVEIPGVARWALRRSGTGWEVLDGDAGTPDAELTLAPSQATAVLSRGLAQDDVIRALAVAGDTSLGERAVAAIAAMAGRPDGGG
jgi:uncharacterized protein (TIGR03083 family)